MDHVLSHVVRRGMEAHASFRASEELPSEEPGYKMPLWGIVLLAGTSISFLGLLFMIDYTYGHLIATLSMVESQTAAVIEVVSNDHPDAPLDEKSAAKVEPDLYLVKQVPITSRLRKTVKYLRERAGFLSRFRGLSIWLVYHFLFARLVQLLSLWLPRGIDAVLVSVILARLRMGWTHIVISESSGKYWFQRLPSLRAWKKIAGPTLVLAICEQITLGLPVALWFGFGLARFNDAQQIADLNEADRRIVLLKGLSVVLIGLFSAVAIVVPATVSLTRVQASLLPDEVETIIPFDRTFGGKFVPAAVEGGAISMLEAWKTFDRSARLRVLKLYAKVIAMQIGVLFLFAFVIVGQLHLIMGPELQKYASWVRASLNH